MRYGFAMALLLSVCASRGWAWSDHASLLWPVISTLPDMTNTDVRAEPLENFVRAQAPAIGQVLEAHERWTREQDMAHALTPDALRFDPSAADAKRAFLEAIRVNPSLDYGLYRQGIQGVESEIAADGSLTWSDLSFLESGTSHGGVRYQRIAPGALISPAAVMAAANDEPDLGMDVGLFSNNGTAYGARYGFGEQPFGNPNLSYGSQAPFHMGFYHLDWLTRTAQPSLLNTYPLWRVALYDRLARVAFETGHPYWGWRFMGWAMHYLGDLTQPYHALPLPGVGTLNALWLVIKGETNAAIQKVSNRHGVLESYQYQRLVTSLSNPAPGEPFLPTLVAARPEPDSTDVQSFVMALTSMSVAAAASLDASLATQVPARFVDDPSFEWVGSGEEPTIVETVRDSGGEAAVTNLDQAVIVQLHRFSGVARAWVARAQRHAQSRQ